MWRLNPPVWTWEIAWERPGRTSRSLWNTRRGGISVLSQSNTQQTTSYWRWYRQFYPLFVKYILSQSIFYHEKWSEMFFFFIPKNFEYRIYVDAEQNSKKEIRFWNMKKTRSKGINNDIMPVRTHLILIPSVMFGRSCGSWFIFLTVCSATSALWIPYCSLQAEVSNKSCQPTGNFRRSIW